MTTSPTLHLYEEIMLLALKDEKGTVLTQYPDQAVAGAVTAELMLDGIVTVEDTKKQMVDLVRARPLGDPVLDESLEKIRTAKRRASLKTWITRLAGIKKLRHKVARQLCLRGILRAEEDKVMLVFTRKLYPAVNPGPERAILERIRTAIYEPSRPVDPRTVMLVALADAADLMKVVVERNERKQIKPRVKQIVEGDVVGKATREVIQAVQAAVMMGAVMPGVVAGISSAGSH